MKLTDNIYFKLFSTTLTLSAFTFGGGYVIVPLMKEKVVEREKWLNEDEMLDLITLAQSSPGPIAVNSSYLVGYKIAGIGGALATVIGTMIPPIVIITLVALFYDAIRQNDYAGTVLLAMQAAIAAVIFSVVIDMGKRVVKTGSLLWTAMMILSFIAVFFFGVNLIYVLILSAIIGMAHAYVLHRSTEDK